MLLKLHSTVLHCYAPQTSQYNTTLLCSCYLLVVLYCDPQTSQYSSIKQFHLPEHFLISRHITEHSNFHSELIRLARLGSTASGLWLAKQRRLLA